MTSILFDSANNPPDQSKGFSERGSGSHQYGGNPDNRGNWNAGPGSGQGNWNAGPQNNWGNGGGGWGDWNGPRNNPRRGGDEGPHIPPFPPAWQVRNHSQPPHPPSGNRPEPKHSNWGGNNNWNQVKNFNFLKEIKKVLRLYVFIYLMHPCGSESFAFLIKLEENHSR